MFLKVSLLLALTIGTTKSFGDDFFKIAPYSLKNINGHLLLNFQLNKDKKLVIEDGAKIISARNYLKDVHYQIELGLADCGIAKDLRIKEGKEVVYAKSLAQPACATTSAQSEYVFGFISDTQQYTQRHEAVAKVIAHHHSLEPLHFIINGGDVVQNGHKEEEWIEYFKGGKAYLLDIPQIAAIGNHDYRGWSSTTSLPKYFQKYMRWDGSPANGNLFFEMPGFELVIWNSNFSDLSTAQETEMWTWLEEKMKAAQLSKTPLILATHFPVFSSSLNRYTSTTVKKHITILAPMAEKYGVKLILSGHTHMFERSYKDGVNYLVAGPAGGRANKPTFKNPYKQNFDSNSLTFTKIRYSNRTFKLETYNQDNVLIDQLFVNL